MRHRNILAPAAALLASAVTLSLAPAALAGGSPVRVSIRVEGKARTLLAATLAAGSRAAVRKDGHSCPGNTVAGAFNRAVRGDWSATWFSGLGFDVNRILGETADYTKTKRYFELFVNNKAASVGICSLKLVRGEKVLVASVPDTGTVYPLGLHVASTATAGGNLKVTVLAYDAKGRARPRPGATVLVGHRRARTNSAGIATVKVGGAGRYVVRAFAPGYIRDEAPLKVVS